MKHRKWIIGQFSLLDLTAPTRRTRRTRTRTTLPLLGRTTGVRQKEKPLNSKKRCKAKERIPEKEIPNPSVNDSRRLLWCDPGRPGCPSMEVDEELFSDPLEEEDNSCDEIKDVNKDTQFPVHHTVTQLPPVAPWRRPPSSPLPTPHPPTVNSTLARPTPCVVCTFSAFSPNEIIPRFCRPCGEAAMRHHTPRSFGLWYNLQTVALFKGLSRLENPLGCCSRNKHWLIDCRLSQSVLFCVFAFDFIQIIIRIWFDAYYYLCLILFRKRS